jgi:hypothetical protein
MIQLLLQLDLRVELPPVLLLLQVHLLLLVLLVANGY